MSMKNHITSSIPEEQYDNESLNDFLENAPIAMHWVDRDGVILWANAAELEMLGYEREEYIGHNIREFYVDTSEIEDIIMKQKHDETLTDYPVQMMHSDGSLRHMLLSSNVHKKNGKVIHTRCFTRSSTEYKQNHDARGLLAAIVDSSEDAIISKTLNGIITSWNKSAEQLFGYTDKEAIGQSVTLIIPPNRQNEEVDIIQQLRRGKKIHHFETVRRRKDGTLIDVSLTISPVKNFRGEIVGASKTARDITKNKQEVETRNLLAAIVRSSDDAIISKTLDGIITSMNPSTEKLYGYTEKEVIGQSVTMFFPEYLKSEEEYLLGKILKGEHISHFETIRLHKDGTLINVSLTISPVMNSFGEIVGASTTARDITRQKEAEAALAKMTAESEQQKRLYESIFYNIPDFVFVFDLNFRLTFVNDSLLQAWGRTSKEAIGQRLEVMGYEPWQAEMHEQEMRQAIATKKPVRGEIPFPHAKLGTRIYDYIFVPVLNAEGNVEHITGTIRDVTERKEAEETQQLLMGELNHRVKNTLATIQAIAAQTLQQTDNPSDFVDSFNGRLHALSRSHSLLTKSSWEGAYLEDIVSEQLPLEEAMDRIEFGGPEVFLSSKASLYLALVIHELGTNACKYGSLSTSNGQLLINWKIKEVNHNPVITLTWVEKGELEVTPPETTGFGMTLIEQSLKSVDGETNLQFDPSGLKCEITLPISTDNS